MLQQLAIFSVLASSAHVLGFQNPYYDSSSQSRILANPISFNTNHDGVLLVKSVVSTRMSSDENDGEPYSGDDSIAPSDVALEVEEEKVSGEPTDEEESEERITMLKSRLLNLAASYDRGFGASPRARQNMNVVIEELESLNRESNASEGIDGVAASKLAGAWRMVWTSAQDVLVLGASPLATVGAIYQIFEPPVVTNVIDFIPRIQALLPVSPSTLVRAEVTTRASFRSGFPNRIGLVFESVKFQPIEILGVDVSESSMPLGFDLPKIPGTDGDSGPGYFDVSFLDKNMLIIRQNAPGGLFVLCRSDDSKP